MLGEEVRRIKAERGLTNQAIAIITGVPLGTVNRIVADKSDNLSYYNACKIAKGLGISLDKCNGINTAETDTPEPPVFVPPLIDVVEIVEAAEAAEVTEAATAETVLEPVLPVETASVQTSAPQKEALQPCAWEAMYKTERKEKHILFGALVSIVSAVFSIGALQAIINTLIR